MKKIILNIVPKILIVFAFIFIIMKIYFLRWAIITNLHYNLIPSENNFIILGRFIFTEVADYFTVPLMAITIALSIKIIDNWIN
ncbi:MAG: hypothetical protein Ta2B_16430 [Termitinemataceae bacterium]|nr:MAG: hypothetical protein Ta2B_16430 [Termitinemataceae bacterium]